MNRTASILILTGVIAAAAGWAAAGITAHYRERNEARREAAAAEERATRPAKQISALIAQADEVVLSYGRDIDEHLKIHSTDSAWIKRLAGITGSARYEATGRGPTLGIVFPIIEIRRGQRSVLSLMVWSSTLDVMGNSSVGGNFVVGEEATQAIRALIKEAEAAHPDIARAIAAR